MKEGQDGYGKSGALGRICSGRKLVKEAQGTGVRLTENLDNISHVGGKGAQALFNALFVPYISKNLVKYCQLGTLPGRNMKSCLSHQGKQSHCLKRNRFSSGIGAGYDQLVEVTSQPDIDGNDPVRSQQGMPPVLDMDTSFGIKYRRAAAVMSGKRRFGKNKVKLCQKLQIQQKLFCFGSGLGAESGQNRFNFLLLAYFQLAYFVIQADNSHRLNKEGGAGRGLVVYHALNLIFVLCSDRKTVASIPHGDHSVLKVGTAGI